MDGLLVGVPDPPPEEPVRYDLLRVTPDDLPSKCHRRTAVLPAMKGTKHDDKKQGEQDQREQGGRRLRQQEEEAPEESQRLRQPRAHLSTIESGGRARSGGNEFRSCRLRSGYFPLVAHPQNDYPEPPKCSRKSHADHLVIVRVQRKPKSVGGVLA